MTDGYGPVQDEAELLPLARLTHAGFRPMGEEQRSVDWIYSKDRRQLRRILRDGRPVASFLRIPTGHYLHGRAVRSLGVGTVTVDALARGQGLGRELMGACLDEARAEGFPLSTLYASTFRLYRSLGYERAGTRAILQVAGQHLRAGSRELELRELGPEDRGAEAALYEAFVARNGAQLVRGDELWKRVREDPKLPTRAVGMFEGGALTGYLRWSQVPSKEPPFAIELADHAFATRAAAERALTFLADHGTLAQAITWASGPGDPLAMLLPDRYFELEHWADWMVRVLDVPAAFTARGYPAGVEAELHLAVEDPRYEENCGPWVLRVSGGEGRAERGGDARLRADIRALAPLFTGFQSPGQLALSCELEGDDESIALAGAVFAGPPPWLIDAF